MTDKAISEILARWDMLMDKLTEISPKIYATYTRQAFWVCGVKDTIGSLLVLGILVATFVWCVLRWRALAKSGYYDESEGAYIVGSIISGLGALFSLFFLIDAIGYLINPEYYAIQTMLKTLLGK